MKNLYSVSVNVLIYGKHIFYLFYRLIGISLINHEIFWIRVSAPVIEQTSIIDQAQIN